MITTIPSVNMIETGKNIADMRKKAGMTVQDLQNILGFTTPQAIYKWQQGASMPTVDNLVALAAVFGVAIDEIVATDNGSGLLCAV